MLNRQSAWPITIAAALLAVGQTSGEAQEKIPASVSGLASEIHAVTSGGYWSRGEDEGQFRAIVTGRGLEHAGQRLFVQWLQNDLAAGTQIVVDTVAVIEIGSGGSQGLLIKTTIDEDAEFGTLALRVLVHGERDSKVGAYRLTADGRIGEFQLIPISR